MDGRRSATTRLLMTTPCPDLRLPGANEFCDVLNYTRFRPNQIAGQTEKKTIVTTTEAEEIVVQDVLENGLAASIELYLGAEHFAPRQSDADTCSVEGVQRYAPAVFKEKSGKRRSFTVRFLGGWRAAGRIRLRWRRLTGLGSRLFCGWSSVYLTEPGGHGINSRAAHFSETEKLWNIADLGPPKCKGGSPIVAGKKHRVGGPSRQIDSFADTEIDILIEDEDYFVSSSRPRWWLREELRGSGPGSAKARPWLRWPIPELHEALRQIGILYAVREPPVGRRPAPWLWQRRVLPWSAGPACRRTRSPP